MTDTGTLNDRLFDTVETPVTFIAWDTLTAMTPDQLRRLFPDAQRIIAVGIRDGAANLAREEAQKERAS